MVHICTGYDIDEHSAFQFVHTQAVPRHQSAIPCELDNTAILREIWSVSRRNDPDRVSIGQSQLRYMSSGTLSLHPIFQALSSLRSSQAYRYQSACPSYRES